VTVVRRTSLDALLVALDPLPDTAPPPVVYQPDRAALKDNQVMVIQSALESAAIRLFPAWLPGAENLSGPQGLGIAAARAMATDLAKAHHKLAPYVADLAQAALSGQPLGEGHYAPAACSAAAAWAVARSYDRDHAALVIDVPEGVPAWAEAKLAAAAEWFAGQSRMAVWLTGARMATVDKYIAVSLPLAPIVEERTGLSAREQPAARTEARERTPSIVEIPPLIGIPRADSPAECALETALTKREWAQGRRWNQNYQSNPLAPRIRLDLWWEVERCAVEVDGPEHHRPLKYAADRRRDVRLQLDGYAVLRYTNDQVLGDLNRVLFEIETLLKSRREQLVEKVIS